MRSWLCIFFIVAGVSAPAATPCLARLHDGAEIQGALLNDGITLHAPYGTITVKSDAIAEVSFDPGAGADTLITIQGNRISGFINDSLDLALPSGGKRSIKPFEIKSLSIRSPEPDSAGRFLVLMNGDTLSGEFVLPEFAITHAAGAAPIPPQDIDSVWFTKNEQVVDIQLIDGKQARVLYPEPAILLHLESGGACEIPRTLLKTLYCRRENLPPEAARPTVAKTAANSADRSPPPKRMVWIPPGAVVLGSPLTERGRNSDEDPRTHATISRGFWMGQYEVTQGEYTEVMGRNPSTFQGDPNRPVEKVAWHDANDYCARLTTSERENGTLPPGYVYRLPTEAEWEYACRANTTTRFSFGDDPNERELRKHAWFIANSGLTTHPVGQLQPNPWGLYDMHGNVLEWCAGLWGQSLPGGRVTDYAGAPDGWLHTARGGSWLYSGDFSRSANRDAYGADNRCSDLGFRVVLAAPL